jgi:hypothetical protein
MYAAISPAGLKGESSLIQASVPYLSVRGYKLEWTPYFRPMPREYPGVLWKNSARSDCGR